MRWRWCAARGRLAGLELLLSLAVVAVSARAQSGPVAPRPPMGWNSWDSYGLTVTEAQFRANVSVEAERLRRAGYQYAVVDEGWYMENPESRPTPEKLRFAFDAYGRFVPVAARFPSAMAGSGNSGGGSGAGVGGSAPGSVTNQSAGSAATFRPLGDWVHDQGLKFGIHIIRGIPKESVATNMPIQGSGFRAKDAADTSDSCPWDPTSWGVRDDAAGQAWYDSLFRQYADWGVDFIKVDCISDHPYKPAEIRMIHRAIDRSGRPMVLSLSPGPTAPEHAKEVGELSQMWRISDDFWDVWTNEKNFPQGLKQQFARIAAWQGVAKPGNWPDADMLPVGALKPAPGWGEARSSRFTLEEQRTMMTLWGVARSPLIVGANLTELDDATLKLLTNPELLRVNQTAVGSRETLHEAVHGGDLIAWTAELPGTERALALFNTADEPVEVSRSFADFGLAETGWEARDAWRRQDLGRLQRIKATLPPHGCLLLMLDRNGTANSEGEASAEPATPPTIPVAQLMEHVITGVPAKYPAMARAAHVTGEVVMGVEVGIDGKVTQTQAISGPEMLRGACADAAKQWVFRPVEINGTPTVVRSAVVFRFNSVLKSTSE